MAQPKGTGVTWPGKGAQGWLGTYRPLHIEAGTWAIVRPFLLACMSELDVPEGAGAVRTARVLARLGAWAVGEGLPLDTEVVLDPATVERFVAVGVAEDRSGATYRSVLRRIGPHLAKRAPWEPRPPVRAHRSVAEPYSPVELAQLRIDGERQPTAGRQRAARRLLALGAGAGLDGRWVSRVTATDVTLEDGCVLVRVGEPSPRQVPVLAGWEPDVVELADSAGDDFLIGGQSKARNRASALATSLLVSHGQLRLSASRLRSTWLLAHVRMGTRLPELAEAAGLEGVTVLSDLLGYLHPIATAEARRLLRGDR